MAIYGFDENKNKVDLEQELKVKMFQFIRTPQDELIMDFQVDGFVDDSCVLGISYADAAGVGAQTTCYRSGVDATGSPIGVMEIYHQYLPADDENNMHVIFADTLEANRLYRVFWI